MAWNTGLACGFTATRSSGFNTWKYSADMMVASEADEAWCPPTFKPSVLGRMWLAWWMVHDDSHSALLDSAVSVSRRAESTGIAMLRKTRPPIIRLRAAPDFSIFRVIPADIGIPYQ